MTLCETVGAGLLGMAGPVLGASLVSFSGGINVAGVRPLFFVAFIVTLGTLSFVFTQLSGRRWKTAGKAPPNLFRDLHQVLKDGHDLKRWLVIASVGSLPLGMVFPFSQVFAHNMKGADEFVLAAMVAGSALSSIAFAIPLGRLADRVGRKRVLYATIPVFWASNLLLVWAPSPVFLIAAGVLQGFYYISGPISAAMERELVPAEQMGRWLGIARLFRMLLSAGLTSISGLVWDQVGPQFVFLIYVGLDLIVRMPLLISMPETLGMQFNRSTLVKTESEMA
jgi:MFS family permease